MNIRSIIAAAGVTASLLVPISIYAYAMGSPNYRMDSDTVNAGGAIISTSSSYGLSDTIGEVGTGFSSSTNYVDYAGFWVPDASSTYITIQVVGSSSMSSISGISGGSSNGYTSWLVTTNNITGYQLTVQASTTPALTSGTSNILDYAPVATGTPDFNFTIAANDARFGFSPEGTDLTSTYKDNGSVCSTGSSDTITSCWDGFSTTPKIVATRATAALNGATTTIRYQAQIGSNTIVQSSASYSAGITVTALTI